jgi:hypothetical protein
MWYVDMCHEKTLTIASKPFFVMPYCSLGDMRSYLRDNPES